MVVLSINELSDLREKNKDKTIVFCSGAFDLFHAGHILFFEDCKREGDILVVSVGNDNTIKTVKGDSRPVLNETIRMKMVDSLRIVDYCILDMPLDDKEDKHVSSILPLLRELKPDKWIINNDALEVPIRKELADKLGIELVILNRSCPQEFDHISSSGIIKKIKALDSD